MQVINFTPKEGTHINTHVMQAFELCIHKPQCSDIGAGLYSVKLTLWGP